MDMKFGANGRKGPEDWIETADDATVISWTVFESLEELRRLSAVPESRKPAAAGQDSDDNLQAVLDKYNAWLRTFKSK